MIQMEIIISNIRNNATTVFTNKFHFLVNCASCPFVLHLFTFPLSITCPMSAEAKQTRGRECDIIMLGKIKRALLFAVQISLWHGYRVQKIICRINFTGGVLLTRKKRRNK